MDALTKSILLVPFVLSLYASPCLADENWTVTITTTKLDTYLTYPASTLKPVVKASVATLVRSNSEAYKDFYFGNLHVIGSIRHGPLNVAKYTYGQISLKSASSTSMDQNEAYAAVDAAKRVFLDLYLKNCTVDKVVVPQSSFATVVQGFYQNGFSNPADQVGGHKVTRIMWQIVSDPPGQSQYVAY